ncbi:MAG TPA: hypothetical protein VGC56_03060 [Allosphingosinicella sp.]
MFGWLKKLMPARRPPPEALWTVTIADQVVEVTDDRGKRKSIALPALGGVTIETNDSGPWGMDVWWMLFDLDHRLACAFPLGATGEQPVVAELTALKGFDHAEMLRAMGSTANAMFLLWKRNDVPEAGA